MLARGIHGAELLAEKRKMFVPHGPFFVRLLALAVTRQNISFTLRGPRAIRRTLEDRDVEVHGFFGFAAHASDEHERGGESRADGISDMNHLPGQAVPVFE